MKKKQRWDNSITNDNLLVVGYRIGKVQLVGVDEVGGVSWKIDVGSWFGRSW